VVQTAKTILVGAIVTALLLVGGSLYVALGKDQEESPSVTESQQSPLMGVSVLLIDGAASHSPDGEAWEELTTDTDLSEGDYIRTEAVSRVVLNFDDGSALRMNESSTVQLKQLSADDIVVVNQAGDVYSRVVESDRAFAVEVEGVAYTALGTAYQTVNKATDKGVRVIQSKVQAGDEEVDEGKQYYKEHTNAELVDKVTDITVEELKSDNFMLWNLEQDEKSEEFKDKLGYWQKVKESADEAPAETPAQSAGIRLSASNSGKGTVLSWSVSGISAPKGFKIVRNKTGSPTFGKDESAYIDKSSARSYTWGASKAGTFHYRVCVYTGSSCTNYSNTVTIESPYVAPEAVVPGAVTLSVNGSGVFSWTYAGTAPHGFKVVAATSPSPSYPNNSIHFGTSPYTFKKTTPGTYYVRVCKYTASSDISGGCTDYSNEVTYVVTE